MSDFGPTAQAISPPFAQFSQPRIKQNQVVFTSVGQQTWTMAGGNTVHPNLLALLYAGATSRLYGAQAPSTFFYPQTHLLPTMVTHNLPELQRPFTLTSLPRDSLKRQSDNESMSTKRIEYAEADSRTDSDTENEEGIHDCSGRSVCSDVRVKGPWTAEEDVRLKELVAEYGPRWSVVAEKLPGRIGKQCRERYLNHLDDKIKRGPWTPQEDAILWEAHNTRGNRWCQIAKLLPGRPENAVKNRYTSLAHKKAKAESARSKTSSAQQYESASVSSED